MRDMISSNYLRTKNNLTLICQLFYIGFLNTGAMNEKSRIRIRIAQDKNIIFFRNKTAITRI